METIVTNTIHQVVGYMTMMISKLKICAVLAEEGIFLLVIIVKIILKSMLKLRFKPLNYVNGVIYLIII